MSVHTRPGGVIAGFSVTLALAGCLDPNPKFQEPTTSGASDGATTTSGMPGATMGVPPTTGSVTSGTTSPAMSTTGEETTVDDSTTGPTSGTGTDSTGVDGECGDGVVDGEEECDNGVGNAPDADCTPECKFATCGDGYVHLSNEECEDGNEDIDDACVKCKIPRTCKQIHDLVPMASTGTYAIDLDGAGGAPPIEAFCDMTVLGGGWTLIERSPNDDNVIGLSLFTDVNFYDGDPEDPVYRMDKATMSQLSSYTTEMYVGCGPGDYLVTSSDNLFAGEINGQICDNRYSIMYKEAVLKGVSLQNVWLCTGFTGKSDNECANGAWHIDESEQDLCGEMNFPWMFGMPLSTLGADLFAVDEALFDENDPVHACHLLDAERHVMLR